MTVSDSASRGERQDLSGPAACEALRALGCEVLDRAVVPDELESIRECLLQGCETHKAELVGPVWPPETSRLRPRPVSSRGKFPGWPS